ncbi:HEAT repeat domain-containing protein [Lyngbya confervoides]|uniref:HEAT repeat domain-containing protein n=1 Tax=Lyngbya confervoides TaxID=207921 RepID=UPI00140B4616
MAEQTTIAALIQAVDQADSSQALVNAVRAVAQTGDVQGLPTLLAALNFNNPGAAVAAVEGFLLIGEPAVMPLLGLLENQNYGARAWALRALAGIGDPRSLALLQQTARHDHALSVRRAAARGLGTIRWHLLPPDQVVGRQREALEALLAVTEDPEWVVRYGAIAGLQGLAESILATWPEAMARMRARLEQMAQTDGVQAVQARARLALQQMDRLCDSILLGEDRREDRGPTDWQATLDQVYRRKADERRPPRSEGDPQRFRAVAAALGAQKKTWPMIRSMTRPWPWAYG